MRDLAKLAERMAKAARPEAAGAGRDGASGHHRLATRERRTGATLPTRIVRYDGCWFAYATNTSHLRLPTLVSTDLRTWTG